MATEGENRMMYRKLVVFMDDSTYHGVYSHYQFDQNNKQMFTLQKAQEDAENEWDFAGCIGYDDDDECGFEAWNLVPDEDPSGQMVDYTSSPDGERAEIMKENVEWEERDEEEKAAWHLESLSQDQCNALFEFCNTEKHQEFNVESVPPRLSDWHCCNEDSMVFQKKFVFTIAFDWDATELAQVRACFKPLPACVVDTIVEFCQPPEAQMFLDSSGKALPCTLEAVQARKNVLQEIPAQVSEHEPKDVLKKSFVQIIEVAPRQSPAAELTCDNGQSNVAGILDDITGVLQETRAYEANEQPAPAAEPLCGIMDGQRPLKKRGVDAILPTNPAEVPNRTS